MQIIFLNPKNGKTRQWQFTPAKLLALGALALFLPLSLGAGAYWVAYQWNPPVIDQQMVQQWQEQASDSQRELAEVRKKSDDVLHAMKLKMAQMQAKLMRLDALGERLVDIADIKGDEFDFSVEPAVGGPDAGASATYRYGSVEFEQAIDQLAQTLDKREQQLNILDGLMQHRNLKQTTQLAGRPITSGWLSSRYGYRNDPFTGEMTMHHGLDFAAKENSSVVATAAGVVTWADNRAGYGNMVEINHGNGLTTRYAHCDTLTVKPGEIVKAGQEIAKVGSTGRSTGPHVHYEVLKNGQKINPEPFIYQARR